MTYLPKIDWDEMMKVRIREVTDEQTLHLVVKALIVQRIYLKHQKDRNYIKIYTEFPVGDKSEAICDVYYESAKDKEVICYEIQKEITKEWLDSKTKFYKNLTIPYTNSVDWILVDLSKCPHTIKELKEYLDTIVI
jgi:hypothetical protein